MKLLISFLFHSLLLTTSLASVRASEDLSPCVARSPTTGLYYDLNAVSLTPPGRKDGEKVHKGDREESWLARGHDYPSNFTINVCAPVIEDVKDVVGVEKARWKNVSAYYEKDGEVYSIGQQASDPFFRGRKLVLNYTDGSPCPAESMSSGSRTKSTIMSFLCDRDAHVFQTAMSFVGTMDECTYFFEVRSPAACGGMAPGPDGQGLGPAGVFGVIALIAVAAYLLGGCAYQRTVMHQRGWRQCPNYGLWAGMVDFFKRTAFQDMAIILLSSVGRIFRFNRPAGGYSGVGHQRGGSFMGQGRGSRNDVDAENRLIDQLDEEWED